MYHLIAIFGYKPIFLRLASSSIFMFCFACFFFCSAFDYADTENTAPEWRGPTTQYNQLHNYGQRLTLRRLKFVTDEKIGGLDALARRLVYVL